MSRKPISRKPEYLLFGLDRKSRPHASRFSNAEFEAVKAAAELMGFQVAEITPKRLIEIAPKIPRGRVFKSGRAFCPYIGRSLYRVILNAQPSGPAASRYPSSWPPDLTHQRPPLAQRRGIGRPAGSPPPRPGPAKPSNHAQSMLMPAQVVLAATGPAAGWWPAIIVRVAGDLLVLRWLDSEGFSDFVQRDYQVARLAPNAHQVA